MEKPLRPESAPGVIRQVMYERDWNGTPPVFENVDALVNCPFYPHYLLTLKSLFRDPKILTDADFEPRKHILDNLAALIEVHIAHNYKLEYPLKAEDWKAAQLVILALTIEN